jgi:hypothetical protein
MATLVSPGVDVEIIDESFYGGAGPGTVPLVVFATAANKASPSGTGIAPYTAPSQAGKLFLATSQRELIQNFGTPNFKTVQGTPVHGYELNEYGLHAAYQFLGISNRCYVLRADIDMSQLEASSTAPVAPPLPGTYWLDLTQTQFGIFQSNGNPSSGLAWETQPTLAATAGNITTTMDDVDVPSASFGADGQFAVVVTMSNNLIYEKLNGAWLQVGSTAWAAARPTTVTGRSNPSLIATTDTFEINGHTVAFDQIWDGTAYTIQGTGALSEIVTNINAAAIANIVATVSGAGALVIRESAGGNIVLSALNGTPLTTLGLAPGLTAGVTVDQTNTPQYPANRAAGSVWVKGNPPNHGASWKVKLWNATAGAFVTVPAPFYPFNSILSDGNSSKDQAASAAFGTIATGTIYVGFDASNGTQQLRRWNGTGWENLIYEAGTIPPTSPPADGTFWYNTNFRADIMYGDGNQWLGYARKFTATDPAGVLISGSAPTTQSDGTALVDNDLWIDSSDLENYPMLYRYDTTLARWNLIDNTDQTSPFGIVFADARSNSGTNYTNNPHPGTYNYGSELSVDMVLSNFLEPDAPDARTYPDGMLLFNTRYSTNNVKEWKPLYFAQGGFDPNTNFTQSTYHNSGSNAIFPVLGTTGIWVTASGNDVDGTPFMGRKAVRVLIVRSLEEMITLNDDIRSELVYFNLLAAPGYPELMNEMVTLNTDQKEVAFIVGDTPIRLTPGGTDVTSWANNGKNVASTGEDGLTVANEYVGVYYPWGLSTDLSGNEVMIPPSAIALSTLAYNDQVAYPWYAPAGFRRGLVTNASSVGYLTSEGEFKPVILNPGQRDVLYTNKINPIAYIPGRGLVVYGQKTLNADQTALDRVNVARLANYLKYNLDNIVKPFLFEQNDSQTRASAQATVSGFLNGLVGLQALSDYAVICDDSNNTSSRIDANELWIDIAIKPLHAIEFIYIPVRILNTGSDLATAVSQTVSL